MAADLKNRSSMILKYVSKKYSADTHPMKKEMPSIINAVLQCHSGNCSDCTEKSAGTCPGGNGDNWFVRSHSLRENYQCPATDRHRLTDNAGHSNGCPW